MAIAAGYNNMAYSIMQLNTLFFKYLLGLTIFSVFAGIFLVYQKFRKSSLGELNIQLNWKQLSWYITNRNF